MALLAGVTTTRAGTNLTKGGAGGSGAKATGVASTSQTATAATDATSQAAQTGAMAALAQASMQRSVEALNALQSTQTAMRNAALNPSIRNLSTPTRQLGSAPVLNGISIGGLLPGVSGTDPSMAAALAAATTTVPVTVEANGVSSVTIGANSAITLPPTATSNTQIAVSGTGVVGTLTVGGTITNLQAGVVTSAPPGSTISLTKGGTITFSGGSGQVPTSLNTYAYNTPTGTASVPSSWTGVGGLTQSNYGLGSTDPKTVTVTQTAQQAVLTWQSFNIGKNTTLDFDQSLGGSNVGQWVAINEVAANIAPTQVLGAIQAPGQVYVINQNGVIFGGSSQVNVHALVASSLAINPALLSGGLLNNLPSYSYLFSGLQDSSGNLVFNPSATPETVGADTAVTTTGVTVPGVTVDPGAQLNSPTTPENVGGKIALIGQTVDNEGTISTPDGQTILAAGLQVGLKAHDQNDPTLRGLDVYLGAALDPAKTSTGNVINGGIIDVLRGDVTLAGANVIQNGGIESTTSVAFNGRIDLLADYNSTVTTNPTNGTTVLDPTATGSVTFGSNSTTQILPEYSDTTTVVGSQLAESSMVNVQALTINMQPGSLLWAPSANVPTGISPTTNNTIIATDDFGNALTSGVTFNAGDWLSNGTGYSLVNDSGTISLASGSSIDVSGSENVSASVTENIVSAQLRGTELADSPLQQEGALRGSTVDIDLSLYGQNADGSEWIGSPIGDLSGYADLVQRNVGELTTNGGTVALNAGTKVDVAAGANINVSGGWINYAGAYVDTTKVVTADGQVLDISQANPNLIYESLYTPFTTTSVKWNVSQSYNTFLGGSQYEAGYLQGGNGGGLSITAPQIGIEGSLAGNTVAGTHQRSLASSLPTTFGSTSDLSIEQSIYGMPTASTLTLSFLQQSITGGGVVSSSPTPADVVFQPGDGTGPLLANPFAGDGIGQVVNLSANLVSSDGFGNLTINDGDGNIAVPVGTSLSAAAGGSINFNAANIDILGNVSAQGSGSQLNFNAYLSSPYNDNFGATSRGSFILGSGATLDTSGLIANDLPNSSSPGSTPLLTAGGNISIAANNVSLDSGSTVNVSGGVAVSAAGAQTFGKAGTISILSGENEALKAAVNGGSLYLGATLEGFSGSATGAGALNIQAPLVQIGGTSLVNPDSSSNPFVLEAPGVSGDGTSLLLSPSFFSQGGFGNISLTALGRQGTTQPTILLTAGTQLNPIVQSWQATTDANSNVTLTSTTAPLASERAAMNLTLNAPGTIDLNNLDVLARGTILIDTGSSITTDPGGSVTLGNSAATGEEIAVKGNITAPGGSITVTTGKSTSQSVFQGSPASIASPLATVDIAGTLSTAGVTELTENALGLRTGKVLDGGTISITGNIVGESTAVLDVDGHSDTLDLQSSVSQTGRTSTVSTTVYSNGGSISLTGTQELYWDGSLSGLAGGTTSAAVQNTSVHGGSLTVSSGFFPNPSSVTQVNQLPGDITLVVSGTESATIQSLGTSVLGSAVQGTQSVIDQYGNTVYGYFLASTFNNSGLDALTLGGTVDFQGPVTLNANRSISVGSTGFLYANGAVTLNAPLVSLGTTLPTPAGQEAQNTLGQIFSFAGSQPYFLAPTYLSPGSTATGTLNVNASDLTDIGYLSLQNVGTFNINWGAAAANAGDVRGAGTLDVDGNINIAAAQIYPTTENTFTIAAFLDSQAGAVNSGNIVLAGRGGATSLPALPYSAGGTLNIYADTIEQGGVLRAPLGTINLGASPSTLDLISDKPFDQATNVVLQSGSVTSVSAVDPQTGQALIIPYGQDINGTEWEDPAGNDITAAGNGAGAIPSKTVNLVGANIQDQNNATIDVTGGGDLYAYRFVSGTGGTNDILNTASNLSEGSFAIIPGDNSLYAPIDPTSGYVSGSNLSVGERVYLSISNGLPAGYYTLLPARYALLPGAFLVTPTGAASGTAAPTLVQTDGSSVVSGYTFSGLSTSQPAAAAQGYTTFQVASESIVRTRAEYDDAFGTTVLRQSAISQNQSVPLLPNDAGQAVFNAGQSLTFNGQLLGRPGVGGQNSVVEISSSSSILINSTGTDAQFNGLVLGTNQLDSFNSGSLLIGGTLAANGSTVNVATSSIEVDDSAAPLTGSDIIFASKDTLTLDSNAVIQTVASASSGAVPNLVVSGDGTLLRASSGENVQTSRIDVNVEDTAPMLTIGDGVKIESAASGTTVVPVGTLTLDSSAGINLSPSVTQPPLLSASTVNFNGGLISVVFQDFTGAGNVAPTSGLVLSGPIVQALQQNATNLSLLSYSTIDFYGDGTLGADAAGNPVIQNLSLQAAGIRGFAAVSNAANQGAVTQSGVTLDATKSIVLDNGSGTTFASSGSDPTTSSSQLTFNSPVLQLGGGIGIGAVNAVTIKGFGQMNVNASQQVLVAASGSVTNAGGSVTPGQATLNVVGGSLAIATPLITGATASSEQINVTGGDVNIVSSGTAGISTALGADLGIAANSISDSGTLVFNSGKVSLQATGTTAGDTDISVNGKIDVSGLQPKLDNLTVNQYTNGGQITLGSQIGNIAIGSSSILDVSAASGIGTSDTTDGNAGTLSISATNGTLSLAATSSLRGSGGIITASANGSVIAEGQNGNFTLDVGTIGYDFASNTSDLTSLEQVLSGPPPSSDPSRGFFTESQNIRVRTGNVEAIDAGATATSRSYTLTADSGDVTVNGTVDASGISGGAISINASGQVNVAAGSTLTVEGETFNTAGQGGSVSLDAGSYTGSTPLNSSKVTIAGTVDLKVDYLPVFLNNPTSSTQTGDSITLSSPGTAIQNGSFYLPEGTPGNDMLIINGSGSFVGANGGSPTNFSANTPISVPAGSIITLNNPASKISFASGTGGAVPIYLASDAAFSANGATNLTGGAAVAAAQAGDLSGTLHIRGPALDGNGNAIALNSNVTPAGIAVGQITGRIIDASGIVLEGYQTFEPANQTIDQNLENSVSAYGVALVSNSPTIVQNLYGNSGTANFAAYSNLTTVDPGIDIISSGDLTLPSTWDLGQLATSVTNFAGGTIAASATPFHFGAANVPGILTLQAAGNLVFNAQASLTDGFDNSSTGNPSGNLWQAPLLPNGIQSWTYNLVAGADLSSANSLSVLNSAGSASKGNMELGFGSLSVDQTAVTNAGSSGATSSTALLSQFYQTIRTGTGNITIATGNNVQFLDSLATIYTAGMQVANPTQVFSTSYNDFALPNLLFGASGFANNASNRTPYGAQYSMNGGNVTISALGDIVNEVSTSTDPDNINASNTSAESSRELPTSWLDRRGYTQNGVFATENTFSPATTGAGEIESTSWWVDFSNFFEGVGALGGGNVNLAAGGNVSNVDAVVPTNARMPGLNSAGQAIAPNSTMLLELGGGNLTVSAGADINGGVYYVERGQGTLSAGGSILTNDTRAAITDSASASNLNPDPSTWLPTTLFLGKGSFNVSATDSVLLGPVANPFLLPQNYDNSFFEKTYFSTYAASDSVNVSSLTGNIDLKNSGSGGDGSLQAWYENVLLYNNVPGLLSWSYVEPWLNLNEAISLTSIDPFETVYDLMPPTLRATAFAGNIDVSGSLTLSPSATGTVDLVAAGSINGLVQNGVVSASSSVSASNPVVWSDATINLSDANPAALPSIATPIAPFNPNTKRGNGSWIQTNANLYANVNALFAETGSDEASLQTQQDLHADINGQTLHADDPNAVQIYAGTGNISGVTLFAGKTADITAGQDITDIAFYLQNNQSDQISIVQAGRDILPFDATSPLLLNLQNLISSQEQVAGSLPSPAVAPLPGDIQIGGPGTIEVLAGRNLNLGQPASDVQNSFVGVGLGLVSIGKGSDPFLTSATGADIIASSGLSSGNTNAADPDYQTFISDFLTAGGANANRYLPDVGALLGISDTNPDDISTAFAALSQAQKDTLAITIFYDVLRDAGRDHTTLGTNYETGKKAISDLFGNNAGMGDMTLTSREIKTESGGNISLLIPGGELTVGLPVNGPPAVDQGILTVDGGNISIFADGDVNVGTSRIFTLHGGNEIIWSSNGDIAAGASSKTVQSAPPTRVLVDPQSGDIETDLAGLATGGGIGVLETVVGAPPSDVDLIAPKGTVDAGDAGIRASGNLNIAAVQVVNASNISVGGKSGGLPPAAPSSNIAGLAAASSASGAASNASASVASNSQAQSTLPLNIPSIVTVEVLGYGGGDSDSD
jgi:filamentous hemagglutinin